MNLEEMVFSRMEAIDKCLDLGKLFIKHFKKIYELDKTNEEKHHYAMEMQAWLNTVNDIRLKPHNRFLTSFNLSEWFYTAGGDVREYFNSDEFEEYTYDEFVKALPKVNYNVLKALEEAKLYFKEKIDD